MIGVIVFLLTIALLIAIIGWFSGVALKDVLSASIDGWAEDVHGREADQLR